MASKTQKTEHRRKRKIHKQGKERKRTLRLKGSTLPAAKLFGDSK
jgi:hypothetical protein